jgi:hypothetical protein
VTVTCPVSETYTGSEIRPCTASYSTGDGLSGSLTATYSDNVVVGTATARATYVGDDNHDGSNSSATFEIVSVPTYSVSGYVTSNLGAALIGVFVQNGGNTATTAADGSYLIPGLINGIYNFSYTKANFGIGYLEVPVSGADVQNANISLTELPSVRYINGTVTSSSLPHEPLAGVRVTTDSLSAVTDSNGRYSLEVGSGSYDLTAMHDIRYYRGMMTVSTEFVVEANGNIELQLKPGGTISGSVTVGDLLGWV